MVEIKLYEGKKNHIDDIEAILNKIDKLTDNYQARDVYNVYALNKTNEELTIDKDLYDLLKLSTSFNEEVSSYFNPLCGSLSKKWKESLKNSQILDKNTINEELLKMNNTSLVYKEDNVIQRLGEGEIDLGGIAKGYALDKVYDYFKKQGLTKYLINCGKSSILLGEKNSRNGLLTIKIDSLKDQYFKLKNCFLSTSGLAVQGKTIEGVTYSHIINPNDGSAFNKHDAVIVISDKGYFGDALSTAMMLNTVDEIKELEITYNVKTIVIDQGKVTYKHESVELYK